eukprot:CAMPEP_0119094238 /NCGR_PEP_ID=MMETSP1178-20130426/165662_1 /TAXON_ID=33656 /ORGANISM="unid sp, Strain CCMP2000" /LENGTH=126 /DNA_ID=CAMNT_0007077959 /DNA_START=11 /DNA_END=387 /DNA_ORIENTATION=+
MQRQRQSLLRGRAAQLPPQRQIVRGIHYVVAKLVHPLERGGVLKGRAARRVARTLVHVSHGLLEAVGRHRLLEFRMRAYEGVGLRREELVSKARFEVARLHPLRHHEELLVCHIDQYVLVAGRIEA